MAERLNRRILRWVPGIPPTAAAATVAVGLAVLLGWWLDIRVLQSVVPGTVSMKANTALGFVLSGVSLWIVSRSSARSGKGRTARALPVVHLACLVVVAGIGILTLAEYAGGWDLGLDNLLASEPPGTPGTSHPGRMAPVTALNFVLLALGLALLDRVPQVSEVVVAVAVVLSGFSLVGFLYAGLAFYQLPMFTQIALHTAITFLVLASGIIASRPERALNRILTGDRVGDLLVRRMLPIAAAVILLAGWLRVEGENAGLYDSSFGATLFATATIALVGALIFWGARDLNRIDESRREAKAVVDRQAERLSNLRAIDRSVLRAEDPLSLGRSALASMHHLIPFNYGAVTVIDAAGTENLYLAVLKAGGGGLEEGARFPRKGHMTAEQIKAMRIRRYPDSTGPPVPEATLALLRDLGVASYVTAPLVVGDKLIGDVQLTSKRADTFTTDHEEILREVADQLAIGLHHFQLLKESEGYAAELEERVAERTKALAAANEELEAFAYTVSHDLRAPLRAMQGFSQALLEDYAQKLGREGQDYATRIVAASQRMDQLIQDLLTFSRLGRTALHIEDISLPSLIEEVLHMLDAPIRQKDGIVTVEEPLLDIHADRATMVHVLSNLVSNAVKFVEPGATPRVRIRSEPNGSTVRLWVEDNGIGIAAEHHERVWRVFERLHGGETYPGTGIGLAIVRKGVERLGGRVGLESAPGQGSRFWVEMPPARGRV